MTHSKQATKRARQNERRRIQNKAIASALRTNVKKLMAAVEAKDKEAALQMLPLTVKRIDKAAKQHVIHRNTAARKKSQVMRAVGSISA